jgi:hypothetical protein
MKNVMKKVAQIEHNVELASIGELSTEVKTAVSLYEDFTTRVGRLTIEARELSQLGNDAVVLYNRVRTIGEEVENTLKELGINPNEVDGLDSYRSYMDEFVPIK